jgi:predicted PolB exonuclease-like 3'-5' exonuclease
MRTTIDLPDNLLRRTKALAAMRGSSLKEVIVRAVEREVNAEGPGVSASSPRVDLPVVHLRSRRKLDLSKFDFDDLLA